jgi:hypothetical protein
MLGQPIFDTSFKSRMLVVLLALLCACFVSAAGLNDTGQTQCYDVAYVAVPATAAVCGDAGALPRQDARYGRDAQAGANRLTKIGSGNAGFDFTKIGNDGSALPSAAALGSSPADWACTKDNVTGLIWEVKTSSGLRSSALTYAWYSPDSSTNGGNAGAVGTDTCGGTLATAPYNNQCNTQNYVSAVNAATLCGASDWRLPTRRELLTIVHAGAVSPSIDTTYFPNTQSNSFWTKSTYAANATIARQVDFSLGLSEFYESYQEAKSYGSYLRLVRGGQ